MGAALQLHVNPTVVLHAASPYTALTTDSIIQVNPTGGTVTVNLPAAAAANNGQTVIVKDVNGSAATHNITVSVIGGGNIDGSTTDVISTNYGVVRVFSNGTQWFSW
jgi:hypothetical protein